ncbi:TerB family tellurite resistance protein [Massilia sp. PAMC28688]|uniref:tellurite resistance TerB family protein n=1 Tax=Massilia sp. PAMC28688 TaxID=2861283 RepID=UPI001C62F442|nr:TerB family tellurite resistance protein [Massilia sp. PAMC28688]QYF93206.1 TerB family tellurite resistance protein [Massilia sp. PAMC28688]
MRSYTVDSPEAAGRLLALTMVSDGNLAPSEVAALQHSRILHHVALDDQQFQHLLQELCQDMLATTSRHGVINLEPELIDRLLLEIGDPILRSRLLRAMWDIADADGWLADAEAILLSRASVVWGMDTHFAATAGRSTIV